MYRLLQACAGHADHARLQFRKLIHIAAVQGKVHDCAPVDHARYLTPLQVERIGFGSDGYDFASLTDSKIDVHAPNLTGVD